MSLSNPAQRIAPMQWTPAAMSQFDKSALKRALGSFLTGVTIVTTRDADGCPRGLTANSFSSVSLDPPLVSVCIAKTSSNCAVIAERKRFAVNLLTVDQAPIAKQFASSAADRFEGIEWNSTPSRMPIISDTVAWFDCDLFQAIESGDHIIFIGRILTFSSEERHPLGYLKGKFLSVVP